MSVPTHWTRWTNVIFWLSGIVAMAFLALQLKTARIQNPPITAEIQAPPEVKSILRHSCYSCHSNETKLAWFDEIAPISWMVAHDVQRARKHLNFSEIGNLPIADQHLVLFDAVNQIQMGAMPLSTYRRVHPGSAVTPEQLEILRAYVASQAPPDPSASNDLATSDRQRALWIESNASKRRVEDTVGGVPFNPDYKHWKQIGITDRRDNNTVRIVLGNDVAIKAIAENRINPWPDGTVIAKATWHERGDGTGLARAGDFVQVEMMTRDSRKYRSTVGWGWGRWLGPDLKPDGKTADLRNACIDCHNPLRNHDYIFTTPMRGQQ
jgi:hypothetical protein